MKVLFIGIGHIGAPFALAMSKSALLENNELLIYDHNVEKSTALEKKGPLKACAKLSVCLPQVDIVFIAVKPQQAEVLFENIRPHLNKKQIVVSIMAGVRLETLAAGLGIDKIVRAMPNLPAQLKEGMTTFTSTEAINGAELKIIENLIDTTGRSFYVDNEELIDAGTAISGSGPAYVFYFMQAIKEAAKEMGFTEQESALLVSQTFKGTIALYNQSEFTAQTWIEKVSTKGGTTEAAINFLEGNKVKSLIKKATSSAFERAKELGSKKQNK